MYRRAGIISMYMAGIISRYICTFTLMVGIIGIYTCTLLVLLAGIHSSNLSWYYQLVYIYLKLVLLVSIYM